MARRGRRTAVTLTVAVAVLAALLVAVDRVGAWAAERVVAEKVSQEVGALGVTASEPEVTISGWPFLTQVADGRYDEIRVLLRDVSAKDFTLPELDIRVRGLRADLNALMSGDGPMAADRVEGTATIGYTSIRELIDQPGLQISEDNGRLRMRLPLRVAGQEVTAIATGEVGVANGRVRITATDIRPDGVEAPPQLQRLLDGYKSRLSTELALPPLPMRLRIEDVQARYEGIAVTASAQGVPIAG